MPQSRLGHTQRHPRAYRVATRWSFSHSPIVWSFIHTSYKFQPSRLRAQAHNGKWDRQCRGPNLPSQGHPATSLIIHAITLNTTTLPHHTHNPNPRVGLQFPASGHAFRVKGSVRVY